MARARMVPLASPCTSIGCRRTASPRHADGLCLACHDASVDNESPWDLNDDHGQWVPRGGVQVWVPHDPTPVGLPEIDIENESAVA